MELVIELTGAVAEARAAIEKVAGVASVTEQGGAAAGPGGSGGRFIVSTAQGTDPRGEIVRAAAQASATVLEIASNTTLEEVFRALTTADATTKKKGQRAPKADADTKAGAAHA